MPATFMGLVFGEGSTGALLEAGWDASLFADL